MEKEPTVVKHRVFVSCLGGFSLTSNSITITDEINRSQKIWSVLAYLIIHHNRSIPQSELIEQFWSDEDSINPLNALKTLLCRIRMMLTPMFDNQIDPILSQRGSYLWNRSILCEIDIDFFESLCRQAANPSLPPQKRIELYEQAVSLYKGDFLPRQTSQLWTASFSLHYHMLYLNAVKAYALLLEHNAQFAKMTTICTAASQLDLLDEELHILIIRSLLYQKKEAAALIQYGVATDLLYRNLGVRPSDELQALYKQIMAEQSELEIDLDVIQSHLSETAMRPGAYICEFGFFKEAYRLEARRAARSGISVHLGLITLSTIDDSTPSLELVNTTMEHLQKVLTNNLRRGDLISKYSVAQFVLLLPSVNYENSIMVMERIVSDFYRLHRRNRFKLSYKIRDLNLN